MRTLVYLQQTYTLGTLVYIHLPIFTTSTYTMRTLICIQLTYIYNIYLHHKNTRTYDTPILTNYNALILTTYIPTSWEYSCIFEHMDMVHVKQKDIEGKKRDRIRKMKSYQSDKLILNY